MLLARRKYHKIKNHNDMTVTVLYAKKKHNHFSYSHRERYLIDN